MVCILCACCLLYGCFCTLSVSYPMKHSRSPIIIFFPNYFLKDEWMKYLFLYRILQHQQLSHNIRMKNVSFTHFLMWSSEYSHSVRSFTFSRGDRDEVMTQCLVARKGLRWVCSQSLTSRAQGLSTLLWSIYKI